MAVAARPRRRPRGAPRGARWARGRRLTKPGPAISTRSRCAGRGALELDHDLGRDVARRHAERLGELQGDVGGEVAVLRVVGRGQLDARRTASGSRRRRARRAARRGAGHGSRRVAGVAGALRRSPCSRIVVGRSARLGRFPARFGRVQGGRAAEVSSSVPRRRVCSTVEQQRSEGRGRTTRVARRMRRVPVRASAPSTARSTASSSCTRSRTPRSWSTCPGFGRQVLHAGRRPSHDDEHGAATRAEPGLYLDPRSTTRCSPTSCVASALGSRRDSATTTRRRR